MPPQRADRSVGVPRRGYATRVERRGIESCRIIAYLPRQAAETANAALLTEYLPTSTPDNLGEFLL
jgi:hypothetical protein